MKLLLFHTVLVNYQVPSVVDGRRPFAQSTANPHLFRLPPFGRLPNRYCTNEGWRVSLNLSLSLSLSISVFLTVFFLSVLSVLFCLFRLFCLSLLVYVPFLFEVSSVVLSILRLVQQNRILVTRIQFLHSIVRSKATVGIHFKLHGA